MLKLSQYLKIGGVVLGGLGALKILFAEIESLLTILSVHWICLIVVGLGAAVYFAGVWEASHEKAVAAAKSAPVTGTSAQATVTLAQGSA